MTDADLLSRADAIAAKAYAPYSNFHVGVAVLLRDGTVIEGVNVENGAYPLGICAEKNAIGTAIMQGYGPGDFEALAVNASPCGGCRQWFVEFGLDRVTFRNRGEVVTLTPAELLPESFELAD
ncbi:MAG: cytidine deaminase [Actinobacteria bacterium]|nr:cytidine deaminase [Actinomycetota bacterium]